MGLILDSSLPAYETATRLVAAFNIDGASAAHDSNHAFLRAQPDGTVQVYPYGLLRYQVLVSAAPCGSRVNVIPYGASLEQADIDRIKAYVARR
jgi:hypothetical protein